MALSRRHLCCQWQRGRATERTLRWRRGGRYDLHKTRLRVSGMLADSIMMGIVNSAMENAYKNSCSKQGVLVRLNEKSRFCELATMQLEWCVKFLQEDTEYSSILESSWDRDKLLSDLWLTRDRIHNRLKETELMIVEKDRELSEIMEIESNLRLALEVKDEDITTLNTELGLEREKHKGNNSNSMDNIGGEGKSCVHEQLKKVKAKLEDGQHNMKCLMRRMSSRSFDFDRLISEFDVKGEAGSPNNFKDDNSMIMLEGVQSMNLEIEFKELALDMDILKDKIDSSFKTMASSISLFKTMLDEQRWVWNAENETTNIIITSFLREVQCKLGFDPGFPVDAVSPVPTGTDCAPFMGIASLHKEPDYLALDMGMAELGDEVSLEGNKNCFSNDKVFGGLIRHRESTGEGNGDSASMFENAEDFCEESPSCRSVAEKIRSHEFFIQKKTQESLRGSREKGPSTLQSEGSLNSVKDMITRVSSSVESILKERADIVAHCDDLKWKVARDHIPMKDGLQKVVQSMGDIPENQNNGSCCSLICFGLSEDIKQLRQENEDLEMKSILSEETYSVIVTGLITSIHMENIDNNIGTQIRDNAYTSILSEMIKEWSNDIESCNTERLFMEEIYTHILNEIVKDICCAANSSARSSNDPFYESLIENSQASRGVDTVRESHALPIHFSEREGLILDFSSASMEPNIHLGLDQNEFEKLNRQDDVFSTVNERSGKVFQQLKSSDDVQLKKRTSSRLLNDVDAPHDQVTSATDSTDDADHALPKEFQLLRGSFTEFLKRITDFEVIACGKIETNMKRLKALNHCVPSLIVQVTSVKNQRALYQKAFIRRCCDLQTAEVEVDLLGDEVDLLYGLVEKIYKVLNHYSPILQHYCGIIDVLRLIRKRLHGEETCATRSL